MKWYTFASEQNFNTWHDNLKEQLGYPLPSVDIDGNVVGEPYTTKYTYVVKVSDTDWRAIIDSQYAQGLVESEAPVFPDERIKS